jgi:DNA polymerase III delta subunit
MLIFLYGPDTYRLSKKAGQIIEEYKKQKNRLDFSVVDAVAGDTKGFLVSLRQVSLFQEKKFFVVKGPVLNKDFKEMLVDNIDNIVKSGHNVMFCQEGKVLKNDRLLSSLKKYAQIQEFAVLDGAKLAAWAANEFKVLGSPIGAPAVELLSQRVGGDLWRLENEIQKLSHRWPGREITAVDVERNVNPQIDTNIFKTIDAVAARDKKEALRLVKEHLDSGDHPLYLLAMIVSQFKNLVSVKSGNGVGGAARFGIHPYVFSKTAALARQFGSDELKAIYRKICQTDLDIKTGKIGPEVGLDLLIANM